MNKDYFHVLEVEPQELMQLLLEHFSFAQHSDFFYKFQKEQLFLDVMCDETGHIISITPSTNFPNEELDAIEQKIQETLLTTYGTRICQIIGFCGLPITGYFCYKDQFQILPLPEDAPKPNVLAADHPFILEVPYEACPNFTIEAARKQKKAVIYMRLLNLFSNQFFSLGSRTAHAWVLNTDDRLNLTSEWKQLGYVYPKLQGTLETFSAIDNLHPIDRVVSPIYYHSPPLAIGTNPFAFPDNLELSLDRAFALDEENWRKFFMACSWYAQYRSTAKESRSSAFIALVTALECLAQEKEKCKHCNQPLSENVDLCQHCGQPRYRVTVHFREFLQKYVPNIDNYPKEKKAIYQVRSQLAHGTQLLQADLEPWNFLVDAKEEEQGRLQRNLFSIARLAIYNWLHTTPFGD